ncbi:MAG: GNAT family protein [Methanomassiliicoccales archaeon]|jgi:ribosomal-protein-alanine N-acetyltransferase
MTGQLSIRQIRPDDAEAIFAFKSDANVTACYGQEPHNTLTETREWLNRRLDDQKRHEVLYWIITQLDVDRAIGSCCLWNFDPCFHCAELGYELHRSHWHKGIMTEALSAVLTFGFADLGLNRVEANPLAVNVASQRLLLRLGFKREGVLRQRVFFHGAYIDQFYFGLLREDWSSRKMGGFESNSVHEGER